MQIIECPHCHTRVVPATDGTCPACHKNTQDSHEFLQFAPAEPSELYGVGDVSQYPSQTKTDSAGDFRRALIAITPWVIGTPTIVGVNILIFVAMILDGVHPLSPTGVSVLEWGANFGPDTMNGQWWRLVTSMFLHFGILHLAFNMWILWGVGQLVERLVGNIGFIILYFVSGIAGSIASLAWNSAVISAGASGAVFGVIGALLGVLVLRRDTVPAVVLKQLQSSMTTFLIYNLVFGLAVPGIDMAAHVGGLAAGFLCGLMLSQPLSAGMIQGRLLRNVYVAVIGAIVLPVAFIALPEPPIDIDAKMRRCAKIERRALKKHNELASQAQTGDISHDEFAKGLATDVLPAWIEIRQEIEKLVDLSYADRPKLQKVIAYLRCREESWQLKVEGLNAQDLEKLERADVKWKEAEEMVRKLTAR